MGTSLARSRKRKRLLWWKQKEEDAASDVNGSMSHDKDFHYLFGKQWKTIEGLCSIVTCSDLGQMTPHQKDASPIALEQCECMKPRLTARKILETLSLDRCEKPSPREIKGLGLSSLQLRLMS